MTYDFRLSCSLPAPPEEIYDAWLDSACHSAMTGAPAKIGQRVGDPFAAWDGYIAGKTLELIPGSRIFQSWRTSEFGAADPDSMITVELEPSRNGTRLTLTHSGARRSDRLRERRLAGLLLLADAGPFRPRKQDEAAEEGRVRMRRAQSSSLRKRQGELRGT